MHACAPSVTAKAVGLPGCPDLPLPAPACPAALPAGIGEFRAAGVTQRTAGWPGLGLAPLGWRARRGAGPGPTAWQHPSRRLALASMRSPLHLHTLHPHTPPDPAVPTTNPTSTAIFKALLTLKTRNALILCPHPRATKCTAAAARIVRDAAEAAGCPPGVISWIDSPSLPITQAVMSAQEVSLVLATGGPSMVRRWLWQLLCVKVHGGGDEGWQQLERSFSCCLPAWPCSDHTARPLLPFPPAGACRLLVRPPRARCGRGQHPCRHRRDRRRADRRLLHPPLQGKQAAAARQQAGSDPARRCRHRARPSRLSCANAHLAHAAAAHPASHACTTRTRPSCPADL